MNIPLKIVFLINSLIILFIFYSCQKSSLPIVSSTEFYAVSSTSAKCKFLVNENKEDETENVGIYWGKNKTLIEKDNKTNNGFGNGEFNAYIEGLEPNTTYYIKAYASTKEGIAYDSILSFTTTEIVEDIEHNKYETVRIGDNIWFSNSLKTTLYNDSTSIEYHANYFDYLFSCNYVELDSIWESLNYGGYRDYFKHKIDVAYFLELYENYSYNIYVANSNKICPNGWHVSTYQDWESIFIECNKDKNLFPLYIKLEELGLKTTHYSYNPYIWLIKNPAQIIYLDSEHDFQLNTSDSDMSGGIFCVKNK